MSTETTNKKIKIDNGTTFGRTYTDKAVDELLKNAGGGGFKKVSANMAEHTWDVSQVDITKDRIIILTDASGNSLGIVSYSQINSNPFEFGYTSITKMLSPYVGNYGNSVEYNTLVLKLDGTIDMIYEGYYYDDIDKSMTFFNENLYTSEDNYSVSSLVVPTLPAGASTKNLALNSVNGTLTWNTIGDGLTIENGVLKTTEKIKIFQPTITEVSSGYTDANKMVFLNVFCDTTEIENYITNLENNNKIFDVKVFLKSNQVEGSYLSVSGTLNRDFMGSSGSNNVFSFSTYSATGNGNRTAFIFTFDGTYIYIGIYYDDEQVYSGVKQALTHAYTKDMTLKFLVKSYD